MATRSTRLRLAGVMSICASRKHPEYLEEVQRRRRGCILCCGALQVQKGSLVSFFFFYRRIKTNLCFSFHTLGHLWINVCVFVTKTHPHKHTCMYVDYYFRYASIDSLFSLLTSTFDLHTKLILSKYSHFQAILKQWTSVMMALYCQLYL